MKKKPVFDYVRMEKEPPRVPDPWRIVAASSKGSKTPFVLMNGTMLLKECLAQSENGAHRESMSFIQEMNL